MVEQIYFVDERRNDSEESHAGSKARNDISSILENMQFSRLVLYYDKSKRRAGSKIDRLRLHFDAVKDWDKTLAPVGNNDCVIIQFPLNHHSIFAKRAFKRLRKRGAHIILLIHDLDFIRFRTGKIASRLGKLRMNAEETSLLRLASLIIVHNERMKKMLIDSCNIPAESIISLRLFDYLLPEGVLALSAQGITEPLVIAGNLLKEKAGYVYDLPSDMNFVLYGPNYEAHNAKGVAYCGQATPEELPNQLQGSFGLVWDGSDTQSCKGPYGEYLRVNNPHKTSLYLASGLPVVIWDQAALAPFILQNGLGIVVPNLDQLKRTISSLTDRDYEEMVQNTASISKRLREGWFTKRAVNEALSKL